MMRRILLGLSLGLSGVLVLASATLALAQTETGRSQILGQIESALSDEGSEANAEGLFGFLPFNFELGSLRLSDDDGPWLEVEGLSARLSPGDLLRGMVRVTESSARRVAVHRLPTGLPEREEPPAEPGGPLRLPELDEILPASLPPFALDRFEIDRIELGAPVLGEDAVFTLLASLEPSDDLTRMAARLDLARIDEPTARLGLDAGLDLDARTLRLLLEAEETGGLIGTLAGDPRIGAAELRLQGDGPLDAWQGELAAEIEGLARLDAGIGLALAERLALDLDATIVPGPALVTDELRPLVGDRVTLALRARQTAPQALEVEELRLVTAFARLDGDATLDLEAESLDARLAVVADDLSLLEPAIGVPVAGQTRLDVTAAGSLQQPQLTATLTGRDLRAAEVAIASLDNTLHVNFLDDEPGGPPGVRVTGEGRAEGLTLLDGPPLPEDSLTWDLALAAPAGEEITLERLTLSGAAIELGASGRFDPASGLGDGRLALEVEELAVLTAALGPDAMGGMELTGGLRVDADLALDEGGEAVLGRVDARLDRLAGLPPGVAELIGPSPTLGADLVFRPEESARVSSLTLEGAAIRLGGDLGLDLASEALDGRLRLDLTDLAALEAAAGQPLGGDFGLDVTLGGSLASPDVRLALQGDDLLVGTETFERLSLDATAAGTLDSLGGRLDLAAVHQGETLALDAGWALSGERLALSDLRLSAPETLVTGSLSADLAGPLVEGTLTGRVGDLGALAPWHQQDLAGTVALDAVLTAPQGRQDARISLSADQVTGEFGSVGALTLEADVADAFGAMRIDASAQLDQFRQDEILVRRASLAAEGDLARLAVRAEAEGTMPEPFDLRASALLALLDEVRTVRLEELEGRLAEQAISLRAPATLVLDGRTLRLDELDLRIGAAGLRSRAEIGPERIEAHAELFDFPLETASRFGAPEVAGDLRATAVLSGTRRAPVLELDLAIADLTAQDTTLDAFPPADLAASLRVEGGRLVGRLAVTRLTDRSIDAWIEAPLVLTLDPFALDLPRDGAVAGRLEAETHLARIALLAGLDDQRLEGMLYGFLDLAGTVAQPRLAGELAVDGGAYEHGEFGTALRDLRLRLRGTEAGLVIDELRATDGGQGVIEAGGELRFLPEESFPFRFELRLEQARLVRRTDADATLSGLLTLEGDIQDALLAGRIGIDRAELSIPEPGGPSIAVIGVEEVGDGFRTAVQRPAQPMRLRLDLVVDMPARVFLRGRGIDSEWGGRLEIAGPADRPEIDGTIRHIRGHIDFLDRRFQLREGVIDFDGAQPPMPLVTVAAATQTRELLALIRVEGRAPDLRLALDSEPSVPEDEVLAHVLFDRNLSRITPGQAVRLAAAFNTLAGGPGGGLDVMGRLRSATGLAVLDIGGDSLEEGSVRAGTYLSEDVYLEIERGITSGSGRATVEVDLGRNLSAETQVRESGSTGIGIRWRRDY